MNRTSSHRLPHLFPFKYGAVALLLFVILFASGDSSSTPGFLNTAVIEIAALCRDPSIQWLLVACLVIYFITFSLLEWRADAAIQPIGKIGKAEGLPLPSAGSDMPMATPPLAVPAPAPFSKPHLRKILFSPNLCLSTFLLAVLLRYSLSYDTALNSLQIPILLAGLVFGKAMAAWMYPARYSAILLASLAASALWQPEKSTGFQYHGIPRWSGVWDNPNLYGLLMGVGAVLALCHISGWKKFVRVVLCSLTAILCGYGLFKSYSRGAWLATLCGTCYWLLCRAQSPKPKAFPVLRGFLG